MTDIFNQEAIKELSDNLDTSIIDLTNDTNSILVSEKIELLTITYDKPLINKDDLTSLNLLKKNFLKNLIDIERLNDEISFSNEIINTGYINKDTAKYVNELLSLNIKDDLINQFTNTNTKTNFVYLKNLINTKLEELKKETTINTKSEIIALLEKIVSNKTIINDKSIDSFLSKLEELRYDKDNDYKTLLSNKKLEKDNKSIMYSKLTDDLFSETENKEVKASYLDFYDKYQELISNRSIFNMFTAIIKNTPINIRNFNTFNPVDIDKTIVIDDIRNILISKNSHGLIKNLLKIVSDSELTLQSVLTKFEELKNKQHLSENTVSAEYNITSTITDQLKSSIIDYYSSILIIYSFGCLYYIFNDVLNNLLKNFK